ncbi:MAG: DoxX family protein [Verrucomicrobiota bacterium]|nr:DoxX family protein [Verrucomicrobiota bacterium]
MDALSFLAPVLAPNTDCAASHIGALVLRVTAGLFLARYHGWHKLVQGIRHLSREEAWPLLGDVEEIGMPFPVYGAFAATITQLIGGVAVAIGLLTRPAALAVTVSLLVAVYSNVRMKKDNQLAALYALLFVGFSLYGGGRYSLDAILFSRV